MSSLYKLLDNIKKRPSMYLGKPAISNLRSFLSGYLLAKRELVLLQTEEEKEFLEFQSWLKNRFNVNTGQSWDRILLFYSEDEKTALHLFFELFEEFLKTDQTTLKLTQTENQNVSSGII